jgi:hypothetical protein
LTRARQALTSATGGTEGDLDLGLVDDVGIVAAEPLLDFVVVGMLWIGRGVEFVRRSQGHRRSLPAVRSIRLRCSADS